MVWLKSGYVEPGAENLKNPLHPTEIFDPGMIGELVRPGLRGDRKKR